MTAFWWAAVDVIRFVGARVTVGVGGTGVGSAATLVRGGWTGVWMFYGVAVGSGCGVGALVGIVFGIGADVATTAVGGTAVWRGPDVGASTPETITVRSS